MNVFQRILRHSYVPYYAAKLLWETLRAWGFRRWAAFWLSGEDLVPLTLNGLTFEVRGSNIKTKMTDTFAIIETVHHKLYNRKFFDDEFQIGETDTVVDIGGYIGSFAIPAAKLTSRGRVFSFEPSPGNFRQLQTNVERNRVENVRVFNQAVAATDRRITLFLDHMNPASNSMYLRSNQGKAEKVVEVEAVSLPTLFLRNGIERCDFLKVDCEGAEYEILMSLDAVVLRRIGKIACEVHEPVYYGVSNPHHTPENLANFLKGHGFTVYRKSVNPYLGMMYAANHG